MSPFMVYNQIQGSFPCFCIKYGKVAFYYRNRMRKRPIRAAQLLLAAKSAQYRIRSTA